ncbi:hypothetical protein EDD18DRAFT_1115638 [Armillaria luteobubalina]|uniref:Uncharacterized protein n=1 Tax=Armillaria luteobubalina TaxID=153913 RepID=A0AA39U2L8_9AGAR|nr:hypothetical protein EDD18DRAFT_1115638 [Armillaria luteobubalina]
MSAAVGIIGGYIYMVSLCAQLLQWYCSKLLSAYAMRSQTETPAYQVDTTAYQVIKAHSTPDSDWYMLAAKIWNDNFTDLMGSSQCKYRDAGVRTTRGMGENAHSVCYQLAYTNYLLSLRANDNPKVLETSLISQLSLKHSIVQRLRTIANDVDSGH